MFDEMIIQLVINIASEIIVYILIKYLFGD